MFNVDNKKIIICILAVIILVSAALFLGIEVGKNQIVCKVCKPENLDFSLFWDAYSKLQEKFVNPEKLDPQKVLYGAISGMAKSLGDPYTSFFNPEQAKNFEDDLSGSFEGIGVEIGIKKDQLVIIAPLEDTPGQKAGLKAGDNIIKINAKESSSMTTEEAINLIRGPKGTDVTLTIFRNGWTKSKDIKITRDTIIIPSIKWELKGQDIAYIHIYQFGQSLSSDFNKTAVEILNSSAKKIILDLRDNPGGYLEVSRDIAGWFLERGQVVTIEDFGNDKKNEIYKTEGNSGLLDYPLVVLINNGSASASEILAGALRDNRSVKLIGEKSFGKGSVQEPVNMQGGALLKITIAKWLTPKGASISDVGLDPDIKVEITDKNLEQDKDPQLDKALEIIKNIN